MYMMDINFTFDEHKFLSGILQYPSINPGLFPFRSFWNFLP